MRAPGGPRCSTRAPPADALCRGPLGRPGKGGLLEGAQQLPSLEAVADGSVGEIGPDPKGPIARHFPTSDGWRPMRRMDEPGQDRLPLPG
jgi:hypothetical protein